MLSPSLSLLISIAVILILLGLRIHPGFAIFAGSVIVSILVLPLPSIPHLMLQSLIDYETLKLLIIVASALSLSSLMEERGLLAKLATAMEGIGSKIAIHLIPAVIGLVPMPAGALVSATVAQNLLRRIGLNPQQSTFINYWFRHIWEFSVPVYPAIIIASTILSLPLLSAVKILYPMTALSIVSGAVVSYGILRKRPEIKKEKASGNIALDLLKAAWPILLLVPSVLLGLDAIITFPSVLVLLIVQQRARWPELKKAFKYGLNPKVLFLLYAIMLYKATIDNSGTAEVLITDMQAMGLPAILMLVVLPLLTGLATGYSPAFVGVALPLLVPYIISDSGVTGGTLLLVYVSGMMGVLLSPLHLCLILSAEYFKARLAMVYKYLLPLAVVMEGVAITIYYLVT